MADTTALFGWTVRVTDRPTGYVREWHYVVVDHRRVSWIDDDGDLKIALEASPDDAKKYTRYAIQAAIRENDLAALQLPNPTNSSPIMVNVPTRLLLAPFATGMDFEAVRRLYLDAHLKIWALPDGFRGNGPQLPAYGWTVNTAGKRVHVVVCEDLFAQYPEDFEGRGMSFACGYPEGALREASRRTDTLMRKPEAHIELPEPVQFSADRDLLYPNSEPANRYLLSAYQYARVAALRKASV